MIGFGGKWLWPCTPMEEFSEVGHQRGTFLICYQLTLASTSSLQEGHVRTALGHLYRKVPNLRVCYGLRGEEMWLREVTNTSIDFEVVNAGSSVWDVMNALRSYKYNSETGPLWCVRILPETQEALSGCDHQPEFKHCYQLFLGLHHGIADGFTAMTICGFIVTLLNDVMAGKTVNDEEQFAEYVGQDETNRLIKEKKLFYERNPALKDNVIEEIESKKDAKSIFRETFQSTEGSKNRTRSILHFLEPDMTSKFIQRCRAEKVTVHSAFTALANIAMVDLVVEQGLNQEFFNIINNHVINIRRYWSGDVSRSLGCHIVAPLRLYTDVPKNIPGTFWDYARQTHKSLQDSLNDEVILRNQAIAQLMSSEKMDASGFFYPSLPADYSTSNLGDVTALVTEGGDYVRPLRVLRSVSIHSTNASWSHLFNTFKGRFIHVLDYNNSTMTKELAQIYSDKVFSYLEDIL